jgi:ABC-2 type transport system permease protein
MLTNIRLIAWHEYLINARRIGFILGMLAIPTLGALGLLVTVFFSGEAASFVESQFADATRPILIGLVDRAGLVAPLPPQFEAQFRLYPGEAAAKQALLAGSVGGYVVIPPDYVQSGEVKAYAIGGLFDTLRINDTDQLTELMVRVLVRDALDDTTIQRLADPVDLTPVMLDKDGNPEKVNNMFSSVAGFIIPYVLSFLLIISIFSSSAYLLRSVSEEKESRVIEVVLSSVSAQELLAGKVLGLGALGLTQVLVWIVSGMVLSGGLGALVAGAVVALNPLVFALSVIYFLFGYLLFGTIMATAGSLGTSMRESQQLAGVFSFMAAVPLMFNSVILAAPNGPIARGLSYFPFTAPAAMMLRLPLGNVPVWDHLISLTVLGVTVPAVMWAGGKIFRAGLLVYGKRPSLKQIWRSLREA